MDLVMPEMGGLDSILSIRETNPDANFIILTSSARKDEVVTAKTIGVSAYIIKPFKPEELISVVNRILRD